ncbi:enoyl-CoA hydratase [Rummeliibacillus stabekisii]|uniref:enoyl-CoA hydratase n=1 Tax=Rummeliibacillus stabekisii TaxID=241244 RepID=UPI00371FDA36
MRFQSITFEKNGRLAIISLNRPNAMNAMDDTMLQELAECFELLKNDGSIQVLMLKGSGKVFSAGGDIKTMLGTGEDSIDMLQAMDTISRMIRAYYKLPMITIAAVHGAAAGLGFSLALASDIIIAEENSKLAMNFIGIGLIPDGGGHFFMKERVGVPKAKQLIWEGKTLDGPSAKSLGLIDQVAEKGTAVEQAVQLAQNLLHSPLAAMIETKRILNGHKQKELDEILALEAQGQQLMRQTSDHLEGIQAFIEKRDPHFEGK